MKIDGAGALTNTLFLPLRYYRHGLKVVGDMYVPDGKAYLVDEEGRVHLFKYDGKLLRPDEPGYEAPVEREECDDCD